MFPRLMCTCIYIIYVGEVCTTYVYIIYIIVAASLNPKLALKPKLSEIPPEVFLLLRGARVKTKPNLSI